jgi:O-antigen biosynthesis protein
MRGSIFNNKKVLITNHFIVNFSGSELTTYYLAKEFQQLGYEVTIATFSCASPLKELFEHENIRVVNVLKNSLENTIYDIIWSHHCPVLSHCIFECSVSAKKVIFSSLSPFEPLEAPPVYVNKLSLCLANSMETSDQLLKEGVSENKIHVFNNSVDTTFFSKFDAGKLKDLKNICVISNHVPDEIIKLSKILEENSICCDIYGYGFRFEHITPDLLEKYDAIITIGRSIQYGLAMGIPVYCYDRFGGPGFITCDNIDSSEYFNFSGRCTNRKLSANEIFKEIIDNYSNAFDNRLELKIKAKDRYSIEKNLLGTMSKISDETIDLALIRKHFYMYKRINRYYERELQIDETNKDILLEKQLEIFNLNNQLKSIYSSKGWKILNFYYRFKKKVLKI